MFYLKLKFLCILIMKYINRLYSSRTHLYNNIITYKNTLCDINKAVTILPDVYKNKTFFDNEKDKIFKQSWIPLGYTNQFNEKTNIIPTTIHNIPIILTKDKSNKILGYYNVCRHRGCKLVTDAKNAKAITCPYHYWSYSLNGNLLTTPSFKPRTKDFHKANYSLFPINISICNNIIFGNLNTHNPSCITKDFGNFFDLLKHYPLDKCSIVKTHKYYINCNWKLLIDNFIEYYHLPAVHKELVKVSTMHGHKCTQKDGLYISFKTDPLGQSDFPIDPNKSPPFKNLPIENRNLAHFGMLFPNMFIFLFPNHMFSVIIEPINSTESIEHAILLTESDANKTWINDLWNFYDKVNKEDIKICEAVQQGIECDVYNGGRMVPEFESTIHRFHKMIIHKMTDSHT